MSIKPNTDVGAPPTWVTTPGGEVRITNYRLLQLIAIAYDSTSIQTRDQITGGPAWLRSDYFDIVAKGPGEIHEMLRAILEERLGLKMHSEYREAPVFVLTLANKDRHLGPNLHRSAEECREPCWSGFRTGHYTITGMTMEELARGLASVWSVGRPVIDRTGLPGHWDVQLDFVETYVAGPNAGSAPMPNPAADSGPDLHSALRDQLGLRLQSSKAPIEYLVIDHIDRPQSKLADVLRLETSIRPANVQSAGMVSARFSLRNISATAIELCENRPGVDVVAITARGNFPLIGHGATTDAAPKCYRLRTGEAKEFSEEFPWSPAAGFDQVQGWIEISSRRGGDTATIKSNPVAVNP